MTLADTDPKEIKNGNDSTTVFSFDFIINAATDITVIHTDALGAETTITEGTGTGNYSISVADYPGKGSITYPATLGTELATGDKLTLSRAVDIDQETDLQNQAKYKPETVEATFDYSRMIDLQQQEQIDRSLKVPISDDSGADFTLPAPAANTVVGIWDSAGTAIIEGPTASAISSAQAEATAAAASAAAALVSEGAASTSEANAATSETNAAASAVAAASAALEGLYNNVEGKDFADSPIVPLLTEEGFLFKIDTSGGNVVINLSELSVYAEDMKFAFVKDTGDANTITINRGGTDTINGAASVVITSQWETHSIIGDLTSGEWVEVVQTTAIADGSVANAKLADMAQATIKGRVSGAGTGVPVDMTPAQVRTAVDVYSKAESDALDHITLETKQATTSGTAFDFTGLPAGTKRFTVMGDASSLDGTDDILIQLGDVGGIETSGARSVSNLEGTGNVSSTAGIIVRLSSAAQVYDWAVTFTLMDEATNTWLATHSGIRAGADVINGSGIKSLSAELTQVRVTRTGTDSYDGGAVGLSHEG